MVFADRSFIDGGGQLPGGQILDVRGNPISHSGGKSRDTTPMRSRSNVQGRYDAAVTDSESANHWAMADDFSASAANDAGIRRILRRRSRYERFNNSIYDGITLTLCNYLIGTGPRLQVKLPDKEAAKRITDSFALWADQIHLAAKLRTLKQSRTVDGEAFAVFTTNDKLDHEVKLDIKTIECDQIASPWVYFNKEYWVDGIEFDTNWNPTFYHLLKQHPGDTYGFNLPSEYDRVPASLVMHWFLDKRPGQRRGIPDTTSALPLFGQLRRYTLAVIAAAETAADLSAVLQSQLPPDEDFTEGEPFESIEIVKRMMMTVPAGYSIAQFKAEQPATTYPEFKREILTEIARCLNIPYNLAAGDSSNYNYASGRLDHQAFFTSMEVEQDDLELTVLTPIFKQWVREARLVTDLIPEDVINTPVHVWFWRGRPHVDPVKEAQAEQTRIESGTTTYAEIYASQGWDWQEKFDEQAECLEYARKLNLPWATPKPAPVVPPSNPSNGTPSASRNGATAMNGTDLIHAAANDSNLLTLNSQVDIEAASEKDGARKLPRFSVTGYTGVPMNLSNFYYPVILDLAGIKVSSQTIPLLKNHDQNRVLGQTEQIAVGETVKLAGVITGTNADVTEVMDHAKNGYKWQASVGASVSRREFLEAGKKTTVNGREISGPMVIGRETSLAEISIVALGADGATSTTLSASVSNPVAFLKGMTTMDFNSWLQARGFDPGNLNEQMRAFLRAAYDAEQTTPPAPSATPPSPPTPTQGRRTLEEVVNAQLEEERRQDRITAIAQETMQERPVWRDQIQAMAQSAIDNPQTTVQAFETECLRLRVRLNGNTGSHRTDRRLHNEVVECALCMNSGLEDIENHFSEQTLEAAHRTFSQGLGLQEVLQIAAFENGAGRVSTRNVRALLEGAFRPEIRAEGYTTFSLPGIMSNVTGKFLLAGFTSVDSSWRLLAGRRPVSDFKEVSSYSLTAAFGYEEVPPQGELKHGTLTELAYKTRAKTYGAILQISRQDIINDDLGALSSIPRQLGRSAALKFNDVFWGIFLNNALFFAAGNANVVTGAGSALGLDGLNNAGVVFANQTGPDGSPLGSTPEILLVPTNLKMLSQQLMNSTLIANSTLADTTQPNANPFAGLYTVVSSPYMSNPKYTGNSTTAWYLLASPSDIPVIQVSFLNGKERPTVETAQAEFDTLGIAMRSFHDWGITLMEYRGGVRSSGV